MTIDKTNKVSEIELSHSMTHYLLVIHDLKEKSGYARVTDISKRLNITKGSVSIATNNLKKKGLVEEEEGTKFLKLTKLGHNEVHLILSSRSLLFVFFSDLLNVEEKYAKEAACLMEHLTNHDVREKLFYFIKTISLPSRDPKKKKIINDIKNFKSNLDLSQHKSALEFIDNQASDFERW
ncbi:MAG: metal-dependent transcriptional regulator [Bdellovibrionaceae bacterium]|jgi:DtxR family transcriptional regulator, Mn-dependent transcriptional regulator|nr:metal-dependent transcriptional regulator [Pseudobdellovibrionaceae bacterium]